MWKIPIDPFDEGTEALREARNSGATEIEITITVRGPAGVRVASKKLTTDAEKHDLQPWPLLKTAAKSYGRI